MVIDDGGAVEVEVWCGGGGGGVVIGDGGAVGIWKKWRLESSNRERLKNNILIKIEFWDVEVL